MAAAWLLRHSLPSALQAFPKRRSVFMGPRILDDEANVADFREPDVVSVGNSAIRQTMAVSLAKPVFCSQIVSS